VAHTGIPSIATLRSGSGARDVTDSRSDRGACAVSDEEDGDDFEDFDEFEGFEFEDDEDGFGPLDEHESALVQQDLLDLERFIDAFAPEGYRGVSVYCHDCAEEHYYPWDMLRENLRTLLETGETPVHEPAFAPDPDDYIPWEYARGYVDALADTGADQRTPVEACPRCHLALAEQGVELANYCPRCGAPLLRSRLLSALAELGLDEATAIDLLQRIGLPT